MRVAFSEGLLADFHAGDVAQMSITYDGRKVWFDRKGYATVWVDGKSKKVHVLEWEKHNGPKPEGHDIHHRDENKANWSIENLELLTTQDHQRVHAGWIKVNGEWAKKPCTSCGEVLPLGEFYPRKGYTPSARCKRCHCQATKDWQQRNPERRKEIALKSYRKNRSNGLSEIGGQNA